MRWLETLIVIAIVALCAAIAIPFYTAEPKQSNFAPGRFKLLASEYMGWVNVNVACDTEVNRLVYFTDRGGIVLGGPCHE